jgi:hypothetical protein
MDGLGQGNRKYRRGERADAANHGSVSDDCAQARLPVQFNLFAFMPEVFGGINPYLDPEAVQKQQKFVASMVQPFARVPFLIWDVINEPSFDNPKRFFATHPNGDAAETDAWNNWLLHKYGSRGAIESEWKASFPVGPIPRPTIRT